jgi:hypothetical protein
VSGIAFDITASVRIGASAGLTFAQKVACRVDRRLHFLLGDVGTESEIELQRDHRSAARARGRHLVEPRHFPELALERHGHRRRHDFRASARQEGLNLDRRIVDFRKR